MNRLKDLLSVQENLDCIIFIYSSLTIRGVVKGTKSLLQNSVYGIMSTASKLTNTLAKIGATATFDDDYKRERAKLRQQQAENVGEGLAYGVRDFGLGLYKGVTGVVLEPIKGAQNEGAIGAIKGIGKGAAGVVLKPVIGAVDLVTRTTEGIKNTASDTAKKARIRPPRLVAPGGELHIYNQEKALGQELLNLINNGRFRDEYLAFHFHPDPKHVFIVTKMEIIYADISTLSKLAYGAAWKCTWHYLLAGID